LVAKRKGRPIKPKNLTTVTVTLFLVVAIMHLLRIIFGWQVEIGGLSIPFWVSWLGVLVAGALAYLGFTQKR
jgi:protein-S-isoprenylcysteine O-methyltransferase Ste14